jgi:DNA-binding NarL/FixJ family response regulator
VCYLLKTVSDSTMDLAPYVQKVLLVEDNVVDAERVMRLLRSAAPEVDVIWEPSLLDASARLDEESVDVVLLDLGLPDAQRLSALDAVWMRAPGLPIVVVTGHDDDDLGLEAVQHGAQEFLVKGDLNERMLVRSLVHAVERRRFEEVSHRQQT